MSQILNLTKISNFKTQILKITKNKQIKITQNPKFLFCNIIFQPNALFKNLLFLIVKKNISISIIDNTKL